MRTTLSVTMRAVCLLLLLFSALAGVRADAADTLAPAIDKGQRVFICGHSFHVYVGKILEQVTGAAGITGHTTVGEQFLGGSTVTQHWDLPDEKNAAKTALRGGKVDVLTLSPHTLMPDPGIDKFADLAIKYNPDIRVFVQLSWYPWDGLTPDKFQKSQYDAKTPAELAKMMDTELHGDYYTTLKAQLTAINKRHGKTFVFLVPAGFALNALRQQVAAGTAPGIAKQTDLFTDAMGHPARAVQYLVGYCFYAAIYHRNPQTLLTAKFFPDPTECKQQQLLQRIAWEATCAEGMSGVK